MAAYSARNEALCKTAMEPHQFLQHIIEIVALDPFERPEIAFLQELELIVKANRYASQQPA